MAKYRTQLSCSDHAKNRIKERMGVEGKAQIKEIVKSAYHQGLWIKKNYIPKSTLWWIDKKVNRNYFGRCSNWRIYNNYLFLFNRTLTLITVIEIPQNLQVKKKMERW